jgi:hypothetical protein
VNLNVMRHCRYCLYADYCYWGPRPTGLFFELWGEETQKESHNWFGRTSNRELVAVLVAALISGVCVRVSDSERQKEESAVPPLADCDWNIVVDVDLDAEAEADAEVDWEAPVYNSKKNTNSF